MKKNIILIILASFFSFYSNAQVGIGTLTPNASAALDLDVSSLAANNKKGLLLPRVNLLHNRDVATIASPAEGLVIFNLQDSNLNGDITTEVYKDTFYFWDGTRWMDITTIDVVKRELLPQVFFIVGDKTQVISTVNATTPIIVDWQPIQTTPMSSSSHIYLNSGNNIVANTDNTFTINKTGKYEVSGSIVQNPSTDLQGTDLEFVIQSSPNGTNWTDLAKNTAVWGTGTGANAKTLIIAPIVIPLNKNEKIRGIVYSNYGVHGSDSKIYKGTGMKYSRSLKIQYLN